MTPGDAARVLAVAAAFDRRTVGETDAIAWADALDGLDPRECADAVRTWYRQHDTWLMPAHIREIVELEHRTRARNRSDQQTFAAIETARERRLTPEEVHQRAEEAKAAVRARLAELQPADDSEAAP